MIFFYIIYFVIFLIIMGSLIYRIIADVIEYFRSKPEEKEQPFTSAQITINRRESSGLNSFAVWDLYLNGESIGRINDGDQVTITTIKQKNELAARGANGAQSPPLRFFAESGRAAQAVFNNGRFQNTEGMNLILTSDEGYGRSRDVRAGRRVLITWISLIGYYIIVYLLSRVHFAFALGMPFLTFPALAIAGRGPYLDLIDYLSYNYPNEWGGISRDLHHSLGIRNLIFYDTVIGDRDYLNLKIRYEGILGAQIFSIFAYIAVAVYVLTTVNK